MFGVRQLLGSDVVILKASQKCGSWISVVKSRLCQSVLPCRLQLSCRLRAIVLWGSKLRVLGSRASGLQSLCSGLFRGPKPGKRLSQHPARAARYHLGPRCSASILTVWDWVGDATSPRRSRYSVCVCVYIYICVCTCVCIYTCIHIHAHPSSHPSIHPSTHLSMHLSIHELICLSLHCFVSFYLTLSYLVMSDIILGCPTIYLSIHLSICYLLSTIYLIYYLSVDIYRYSSISVYPSINLSYLITSQPVLCYPILSYLILYIYLCS